MYDHGSLRAAEATIVTVTDITTIDTVIPMMANNVYLSNMNVDRVHVESGLDRYSQRMVVKDQMSGLSRRRVVQVI